MKKIFGKITHFMKKKPSHYSHFMKKNPDWFTHFMNKMQFLRNDRMMNWNNFQTPFFLLFNTNFYKLYWMSNDYECEIFEKLKIIFVLRSEKTILFHDCLILTIPSKKPWNRWTNPPKIIIFGELTHRNWEPMILFKTSTGASPRDARFISFLVLLPNVNPYGIISYMP